MNRLGNRLIRLEAVRTPPDNPELRRRIETARARVREVYPEGLAHAQSPEVVARTAKLKAAIRACAG